MAEQLKRMGFTVFPSDANFLLVKMPDMSKIAKKLAEKYGLIIRDFGHKKQVENCARISMGTRSQNRKLLAALAKIVSWRYKD